jgi:prophage antirepressor-like protein
MGEPCGASQDAPGTPTGLPTRAFSPTRLGSGQARLKTSNWSIAMSQSIGAAAPTLFNFNIYPIRVVVRDDEPWFIASDVADALEYRNAPDLTRFLDDDEAATHIVRSRSENGVEQSREVTIINESGLYHAVLKSRKPKAQLFRRWVTSEVLPAVRKTGRYALADKPPSYDPAKASLVEKATNHFIKTQKANLYLGLRESYRMATQAAHETYGVDLLSLWSLDLETVPRGKRVDVAQGLIERVRAPKDDMTRLLGFIKNARKYAQRPSLARFAKILEAGAMPRKMLLRYMHMPAREFSALIDTAIGREIITQEQSSHWNYSGILYTLREDAELGGAK